jgi:hypothetical protein
MTRATPQFIFISECILYLAMQTLFFKQQLLCESDACDRSHHSMTEFTESWNSLKLGSPCFRNARAHSELYMRFQVNDESHSSIYVHL